MTTFKIGQFFEGIYPPEAAAWCNNNNAFIEPYNNGYIIREVPAPSPIEIEKQHVEQQIAELDDKVKSLTDRFVLASLRGDQQQIDAIKDEFKQVIGE